MSDTQATNPDSRYFLSSEEISQAFVYPKDYLDFIALSGSASVAMYALRAKISRAIIAYGFSG